MDITSLSNYRKYCKNQLKKIFEYFETETNESLLNILTNPNRTIRSFIRALIHNEVMPLVDQRDKFMDPYACDLLCLYHRYPQIRDYLEHGFGFRKVRWTSDKKFTKRYRLWMKRWQIQVNPLLRSSFSIRLTQNICFVNKIKEH